MKSLLYCPICDKVFNNKRNLDNHLRRCESHLIAYKKYVSENFIEGTDYVVCQVCGYIALNLATHLKRAHNLSLKEYLEIYPNSLHYSEKIKENVKQTCLERYGVEHHTQTEECKKHYRESCLKKYGVENIYQSEEFKEKRKKTCLELYGVEHYVQTEEFTEKAQKTIFKHYGVKHNMHSEEVKDKIRQTCLEKYGVEYALMSPEIRFKAKKTHFERYGEYSHMTTAFSLNSQVLFREIEQLLAEIYHDDLTVYYATNGYGCNKTNEFQVLVTNGDNRSKVRFLDFYVKELNRWVEFDEIYHDGTIDEDLIREDEIFSEIDGIELLRIKESDFIENQDMTVKRVIHFLTDGDY